MSASFHARLVEIVKAALLEQDARTYSGLSGDTDALAEKVTNEILVLAAQEQEEIRRRATLISGPGIQIGYGGVQTNNFT